LKLIVIISCLVLISCSNTKNSSSLQRITALETLDTFYKGYLVESPKVKDLKFSGAFQSLIDANHKLCSKKIPKTKCGWRVDGDVYLNAQEYDRKLTYKKSGIKLSEPVIGTVTVTLNVFPKHGSDYERKIVYKFIMESKHWVLEDIISSKGRSSREYILKENKRLRN
jgi:hypothetical protein